MDILNWLTENWIGVVASITGVISAASAITALTPTPKDDNFLKKVKEFLNVVALNVGGAKPK
jgi:hypothetical protein